MHWRLRGRVNDHHDTSWSAPCSVAFTKHLQCALNRGEQGRHAGPGVLQEFSLNHLRHHHLHSVDGKCSTERWCMLGKVAQLVVETELALRPAALRHTNYHKHRGRIPGCSSSQVWPQPAASAPPGTAPGSLLETPMITLSQTHRVRAGLAGGHADAHAGWGAAGYEVDGL